MMDKRGGFLLPTRSTQDLIEPEVVETSGALEIPLNGFAVQVRSGTVRLLGYVWRGEGDRGHPENTLIAHFPKYGFLRSWIHGRRKLERDETGLTMN